MQPNPKNTTYDPFTNPAPYVAPKSVNNNDPVSVKIHEQRTLSEKRQSNSAAIFIIALLVIAAAGYAWYERTHYNAPYNEGMYSATPATPAPATTNTAPAPISQAPAPATGE